MLGVGILLRESQQLQVAVLEHECECLRECVVRHTTQHVVVDAVQGEDLLAVMAELVNGDVVSLVVHSRLRNACSQVGIVRPAPRPHCMAGAAGRVYRDLRSQKISSTCREPELAEQVGQVGIKRLRCRVSTGDDPIQI